MTKEFDYIVVGAGSSGCVLAERLSVDGSKSVLLIESGHLDTSPLIQMPRGIGMMLTPGNPHLWSYKASQGSGRPEEDWLKGRVLGGSSSINGMVYMRGLPSEYDDWEAAGCTGWGWRDIGRCFKEMEDHELGADEWRGAGGPLKISVHPPGDPLCEAVIKATEQIGVPRVADLNSGDTGVGYQPRTIWRGRRWSSAKAFLAPAASRSNLSIRTGTDVLHITFEDRVTSGVQVRDRSTGEVSFIRARREVILAAGALHSPKLLQLSGIGPGAELAKLGISVLQDSPGVGRHMLEHRTMMMQTRLKSGSLNAEFSGMRLSKNLLNYYARGRGPLTHAAHEVCALVKTNPDLDRPNAQIGMGMYSIAITDGKIVLEKEHGMTWAAYFTRPTSEGSVTITSTKPDAPLSIDVNYLSTDTDRRHSADLLRLMRKIITQPALRPYVVEETIPGAAYASDEEIVDAYFKCGSTAFHVAGTCRMGADAASVVDPQLRVRGVQGLRVVDTSIMPTLISGNTNGPAMAIAMRAAELIQQHS
ncbi:GMC family oxidoreductase [Herminiimonas arsenitoxidans]|uniref:GMC family oxidoreductase n=1 Tax=Herminiimonas arsenitoxidans TaxID=1809410 RepID=UPI00097128D3|nr:GMC family oxidoreductase N-terminal domain-containing protein [Herminiimonas arsenitoxidans]